MKKILLASALVALFGTAHADVTLGGKMRYDLTKADGSAQTSGVTASEIKVSVSEDLGGGMKATAVVGIDGAGRNETVGGTDAYLTIGGGFGTIKAGQVESANGIIGRAYAGAPVIGADGSVLAAKGNIDTIGYTAPAIGGLTFGVSGSRAVDATTKRSYTLSAAGKVGPVDAGVDYNETTKRVRASASMQVAGLTVGAGWSGRETGVADSRAFGVSMPVGPLTVGATRSMGNGTANEVGAQYNLSKRTSVGVAYQKVEENSDAAKNVATTRVRLQHTF